MGVVRDVAEVLGEAQESADLVERSHGLGLLHAAATLNQRQGGLLEPHPDRFARDRGKPTGDAEDLEREVHYAGTVDGTGLVQP